MNKKLTEMLDGINTKKAEVIRLVEDDKVDEAEALKAELIEDQRKFDLLKDIEEEKENTMKETITSFAETSDAIVEVPNLISVEKPKDAVHDFAEAARRGFKVNEDKGYNNEGNGKEGGYTVPEDILTKINEYKEAKFSLSTLVDTEAVTTLSGRRTYQKRAQHTGFVLTGEGAAIGQKAAPQFEVLPYTIKKYAGYLPVTNELLADSDANITNVLVKWLGEEDVATRNALILEAINTKEAVAFAGIDDIKEAINVTLGQAYAGSVSIVTNDDGFNWLDQLKVETGSNEYLLKPAQDQTQAMTYTLAIGAKVIPVVVVPNAILPTGTGDKMPFIAGDFKEAIKIFDRAQLSIMASDTAAVTGFNAFEQDMTLFRGITRLDVKVKDEAAFVNGYIVKTANNGNNG